NEVCGKSHWKGCNETGLMGMGCRHDQCLRFIGIIQSGKKGGLYFLNIYPLALLNWLLKSTEAQEGVVHGLLGVLYDIGCALQKGIMNNYNIIITQYLWCSD
ncbi:hypothetical protein DFH28DRAFT_903808, partial [Melampsora americana]